MAEDLEFNWEKFWPGEYPYPIINVLEDVKLDSYSSYKNEKPDEKCTVERGQYHPWAKTKNVTYIHGSPVIKFMVTSPRVILDGYLRDSGSKKPQKAKIILTKGMEFSLLNALGEGMCILRYKGKKIETDCPFSRSKDIKQLTAGKYTFEARQFFSVKCKEGHVSWIPGEKSLFSNKNIEKGEALGWGELKDLREKNQKFSASFPCSKASTKTEKLICSDKQLSNFDVSISKLYKTARKIENAPKGAETVKANQRKWIKKRNRSCEKSLEDCRAELSNRLLFLEYLGAGFHILPVNKEGSFLLGRFSSSKAEGKAIIEIYNEQLEQIQRIDLVSYADLQYTELVDANFDGFIDMLVPTEPISNFPTKLYLYSNKLGFYESSKDFPVFTTPKVDQKNKLIYTAGKIHAGAYYKEIYQWRNGKPVRVLYQSNICDLNDQRIEVCKHESKDENDKVVHRKTITSNTLSYWPPYGELITLNDYSNSNAVEKKAGKDSDKGICTLWTSGDAYHLEQCKAMTRGECTKNKADLEMESIKTDLNFIEHIPPNSQAYCRDMKIKNARDVEMQMSGLWTKVTWQYKLKVGEEVYIHSKRQRFRTNPDLNKSPLVSNPHYYLSVGTKVKILEKSKEPTYMKPNRDFNSHWYKVKALETGKTGWIFGRFLHPDPMSEDSFIQ